MDYDSENINRRDEMLSRFRESLTRPLTDRYFDEDELLEIFDYAGDIGDDYLRTEALLCAARYFPDSEPFQERKAIFYNQCSEDAGNKYIDDNQDASGMMWDIMRARRAAPDDDKTKKDILDTIVNTYDQFNDEEVIQFIDLVSVYGQMDWLKENMPVLREKASFINLLLYESAIAADNNQDVNYSTQMLEELTELEPFNFIFWMMLAKAYESLDQGEKALNAIDYALAINPEDVNSLLTRAKLLYVNSKDTEEVAETLKKALQIKPDSIDAVRLLATVYNDQGNKILASALLNDFINKHPEGISDITPELVVYRPKNLPEILDKFYESNHENAQFIWASWAHHLSQNGYPDIAEEVLKAYERNSGIKIFTLYHIENLFIQQRFEEAVIALSDYLSNTDNSELDFPSIAMLHLLSMIKVGEYEHAMSFCNFLESHAIMSRFTDISGRLEYLGMMKVTRQIKNKLKKTHDPEDWRDFDPLELWV